MRPVSARNATAEVRPPAQRRRIRSIVAALAALATGSAPALAAGAPPACEPGAGTPALPLNAWRRSDWRDDVFVAVFAPTANGRWAGNLKKYRLAGQALLGRAGPAVDPATGRLRTDAWSFWSAGPDGDRVRDGGAASRLPEWPDRRLFTDVAGADLASSANALATANARLTPDVLGIVATGRDSFVEWLRGRDVHDADGDGDAAESRRELGASPDTPPVVVDYGAGRGGTTVFLPTRDGYLHAFDAATGDERWAFVPARLLPLLAARFREPDTDPADYGLDGSLAIHHVERDGQPGIGAPGQVVLLFGMGRGGSAVFALDVTDADRPSLLWQVDDTTPGFGDLGQTWSAPVAARLPVPGRPGGETTVLLAGGYDPGHDPVTFRADARGHAVYLVDLQTGDRLWSAGPPGAAGPHDLVLPAMRYSIPAAPRVVDLTGDGVADRFYVGDLGGQLWRFDIHPPETGSPTFISAGVLASLGAAGPGPATLPGDARRFSVTPDVVPLVHYGELVLAVNLGSGHVGRPQDTTTAEAFYSVRDAATGRRRTGDYGPPLTGTDLADITGNLAPRLPRDARGWRLRLIQAPGEKVLAPSLAVRNELYFTSFTPAGDGACGSGTTRLYRVRVDDGRPPIPPDDGSPGEERDPRTTVLGPAWPGLAPAITLAGAAPGTAPGRRVLRVCTGLDCRAPGDAGAPTATYWYPDPAPARR
jgi:type IV pilus assembly protein PilY1